MASDANGELKSNFATLFACTVGLAIGVHALPFYTAGTFMGPIQAEFGWSRAQMSVGPMLLTMVLALGAPLVGAFIDKKGDRLLIPFSLVALSLLVACLALLQGAVSVWWLLFALMALLGAGSGTLPFSRIVSSTFRDRRGTALGIALTGTGLTSAFAPWFFSQLISAQGWRTAYLMMAGLILVLTPFVVLPMRRRQATAAQMVQQVDQAQLKGHELGAALRSGIFWRLALIFPLVALSTMGLIVHFVPLLQDAGLPASRATATAGLIGISMIIARLGSGLAFDRFFAPRVSAGLLAVCAAGLLLLSLSPAAFGWCGAIAIGFATGIEFDLIAYLVSKYFGFRSFGRIYGLLYGVTALGVSISALIYGYWADRVGSYQQALLCASALLVIAVVTLLTLPSFDSSANGAEASV